MNDTFGYDLPQDYIDAAQGSLRGNSVSIPPPYPAPQMYWRHGDPALASIADVKSALRFGGWGIDCETLSKIEGLPPEIPNTWHLHENLVSKANGAQYDAYLTRVAHVAPVKRRWRFLNFKKGDKQIKRSDVEYLCWLAQMGENKSFQSWGWVILSAKSYDSRALDDVFNEFEAKSAKARGNWPINYFYTVVGTFGDAPKFETRHGKDNSTSQVTPPQLFTPKSGFIPETLKLAFVGAEVAAEIRIALTDPAVQAWADSWKREEKPQVPQAAGQFEPPNEDDMPF